MTVDDADPRRLSVQGPLHFDTVETLRTRLALHTPGGTDGVSLDISSLTVLASAGVQLLQETRTDARCRGDDLAVVADIASVAHQVLDLVGIPHDTGGGRVAGGSGESEQPENW